MRGVTSLTHANPWETVERRLRDFVSALHWFDPGQREEYRDACFPEIGLESNAMGRNYNFFDMLMDQDGPSMTSSAYSSALVFAYFVMLLHAAHNGTQEIIG